MCGIAGIFAYHPSAAEVDRAELLRVRDAMLKRGPDGEGLWMSSDHRAGLAHRRLAIIDLTETGAQPMSAADGRFHITFNGEIYNYLELRKDLESQGFQFRSNSDTEVLLHLYAKDGAAMLPRLRGMFAFAIFDQAAGQLFLARDPFGIKPLYYFHDGRCLHFASQVKALLAGGRVSREPGAAGHVGFYLWGHVPDPFTQFKNIHALPAGSSMLVDKGGPHSPQSFFDISEEFERARSIPEADAGEWLREALRDSVRHHLIADVPVGVFLSSGIDSSLLTALCSRLERSQLHTLTLGFEEYRGKANDETPLADVVARRYATRHETHWISRADFESDLAAILEAMDQPTIDGVNTYFVSRAASASGMKVALSGLGADEIFGGYPSFTDVPAIRKAARTLSWIPGAGRAFRSVSAPLLKRLTSPKYAGLFEYGGTNGGAYLLRRGLFMPWELPEILDGELVREGWSQLQPVLRLNETTRNSRSDFQAVSSLELSWYMRNQLLRDADWAGMAHSLEIRVPFVDVELFRRIAPYMASRPFSKTDAARAAQPALPDEIVNRKKTGFSVPVREWMLQIAPPQKELRGLRSWARHVGPPPPKPVRMLALATDAFGGEGGIAKFNRDLFKAICSHPRCKELVAIPRLMSTTYADAPAKLEYRTSAVNSKLKFGVEVLRAAWRGNRFDLVVCCHINLLPAAWIASRLAGTPLILVVHGIDAWQPTRKWFTNLLAKHVSAFVAVSAVTRTRFVSWAGVPSKKGFLLPNSIDLCSFYPTPKSSALLARHHLEGKVVVMTMGRLSSAERYKGIDEVMEILPRLIVRDPRIVYLVAGDGDDRARLEEKARALGLRDRVVFTGYVNEPEKRDYLNLADVFVMAGRGEGFGIVYLEALACGVPTVGSLADGSVDALKNGELGILVNPDNPDDIERGILAALSRPKRVEPGLTHFAFSSFQQRVHGMIDECSPA